MAVTLQRTNIGLMEPILSEIEEQYGERSTDTLTSIKKAARNIEPTHISVKN